tara:strand:- start:111 stop:446 length:336 start_codon:yes stop_codon:yes gene_type:complete
MTEDHYIPEDEEYTFESMDEFQKVVGDNGVIFSNQPLANFYHDYSNINKGCGCKKKSRISKAVDSYKTAVSFLKGHATATQQLLNLYQVDRIIFKHASVEVGHIGVPKDET